MVDVFAGLMKKKLLVPGTRHDFLLNGRSIKSFKVGVQATAFDLGESTTIVVAWKSRSPSYYVQLHQYQVPCKVEAQQREETVFTVSNQRQIERASVDRLDENLLYGAGTLTSLSASTTKRRNFVSHSQRIDRPLRDLTSSSPSSLFLLLLFYLDTGTQEDLLCILA